MKILFIGTDKNVAEGRLKFGPEHTLLHASELSQANLDLRDADVIFDFTMQENPRRMTAYDGATNAPIFFEATTFGIANLLLHGGSGLNGSYFGFCGLPTFLNREILEVTLVDALSRSVLEATCEKLQTKYLVVADQPGMVTPRVICMIINEAYFALEDGTATLEDIDLAMKLGTNYPFGPFEWGERIGLMNVVKLLVAVHKESGDSRYEVCPLLVKTAEGA